MSNPLAFLRALLIYGICVPLAMYLGYLLATPLDRATWVAIGLILVIMILPLLLKWHHPFLIFCWNLNAVLFFLPGQPQFWLAMALASLAIALVQRTLNRHLAFITVWSLILPLLFLGLVILVTGWFTGGIGMRVMNSDLYGGRRYVLLFGAILGFFALCSREIPLEKSRLYLALFFLPGAIALLSSCFPFLNSRFYFIYLIFPADPYMIQAYSQSNVSFSDDLVRLSGLAYTSEAIFSFVMARYGIRALMQTQNWWRLLFFVAALILGLFGGFRSAVLLMGLTFCVLFCVEGLVRTRFLFIFLGAGILCLALALPFTRHMPLPVQRAMSFLPVEVDPIAAADAQASTEWRVRMWHIVWPEVPHYLFLGKGYGINAQDLELAQAGVLRGTMDSSEVSMMAGDYHNGPLSTLIPLGIWGALGFAWLLIAGTRFLWINWRYSPPELKTINAFMLSFFVAKIIFYIFVFGSLYSDLMTFTGLLGFSVCLNNGIRVPATAPRKQIILREHSQLQTARG
jgi:hypothetical protein